ncbi:MAG: DnaT-like ssDNA-binding protein [Sagittula sp.]|uniref:DnaT-like ssDNA-binding protein n=1 Tax=Sagittula sp. TaxID=2038081 RepID=UPI004059598A
MALTVTPGGASDDALLSYDDFVTYAEAHGWEYTAFDDDAIEASLRRGTVYVEGLGGPTPSLTTRWPGTKSSAAQRRAWPRVGAAYVDGTPIASDVIPAPVEDAVAEAAWFDLGSAGTLFSTITASEVVKQEKVGPLSVTYQDARTTADMRPMLTSVHDLLAGLLIPDLTGPKLYLQSIGGSTGL